MSDGEKRDFAATKASPEWFACFQTFFFKVNRQAGRMCGTTDGIAVHTSGQAMNRDKPGGDAAEGMVRGKDAKFSKCLRTRIVVNLFEWAPGRCY